VGCAGGRGNRRGMDGRWIERVGAAQSGVAGEGEGGRVIQIELRGVVGGGSTGGEPGCEHVADVPRWGRGGAPGGVGGGRRIQWGGLHRILWGEYRLEVHPGQRLLADLWRDHGSAHGGKGWRPRFRSNTHGLYGTPAHVRRGILSVVDTGYWGQRRTLLVGQGISHQISDLDDNLHPGGTPDIICNNDGILPGWICFSFSEPGSPCGGDVERNANWGCEV